MNRRSLRAAVAAAVCLSVVVAACGGDDGDGSSPPVVSSTAGDGSSSTTAATEAPADSTGSTPGSTEATDSGPASTVSEPDDIDREATLRLGMELAGRTAFDGIAAGGGIAARGVYQELLYDTMIREDVDGNPVPGLATEWSTPDDFTVDLTLREGVAFHDGTPFDAEAVKFSWERCIAADEHQKLNEHAAMESVDVLAPMQVRLHLNAPLAGAFPTWVLRSPAWCMGIESPTAIQTLGDAGFEQAPVGAGPYRFVSYEPDQKIVFERVDDYWAPGNFARIEIYNVTPGLPMVTAVASDQIDIGVVDAPVVSQAEAAGLDVVVIPSESQNYLYLCSSNPALNDLAARQAIAKAIDRDQLNEIAFEGRGTPNEVIVPEVNPMHAADLFGGELAYDLDAAKQLAGESGLVGQSLDLLVLANSASLNALAETLQQQLKEIGVTVNLVPTQNANADKNALKPAMDVWSLTPFFMSTALEVGQVNNYCGNETPDVSEAYARLWLSQSPEATAQAWHDWQQAVQESIPVVPLVTDLRAMVHDYGDRLGGLRLKQTTYFDFRLLYLTK